jgi:thiosulfate/3-mercaptopyruvate sulfurtransferase
MSNQALVDAEWALSHLDDAKVVFIEVDEDTEAYAGNHNRLLPNW